MWNIVLAIVLFKYKSPIARPLQVLINFSFVREFTSEKGLFYVYLEECDKLREIYF